MFVFVPGMLLHPSVMFADKARGQPSSGAPELSSLFWQLVNYVKSC